MVCTKTLYNYVDAVLFAITNLDLPLKLKRSTKRIRVKQHKTNLGTCISECPEHINDRSEFGHWEIDTIIDKKDKSNKVLLRITEQMTRKEIIRVLSNKTTESVQNSMLALMEETDDAFSKVFKSITADNGTEFADLAMLETLTDSKVYFAHPYSSSECGTNECHNGIIRRFIPKGKHISDYSIKAILSVQNWCNTLTRKILNYLTPDEVFEDQLRTILYN